MEILRLPPYPIVATWTLPIADYTYVVYVEDLVDHSIETSEIQSDANGVLTYEIPLAKVQFDRKFLIRFYDSEQEHVLYEENLDIVRPYANPNTLGTLPSEISEYKTYEMIARAIIDTQIEDGFYNHKAIYQVEGNGADYMPVWRDANRVLKVYENNVLVFDIDTPDTNLYTYKVTLDNSAIVKELTGYNNNIISANPILPISRGDLAYDARRYGQFPKGYDYLFVIDEGHRTIPVDVEKATLMLIEDLKCGNLDYYKRYVSSYNTDQFRVQFAKELFEGTGNVIVDKILDKYKKSITRVGVL